MGSPIAEWFISWKIRKSNGGWLGVPPFQQTSIQYPDITVVFLGIYSLLVFYPILLWYTYLGKVYDRRYHYFSWSYIYKDIVIATHRWYIVE